MSSLNKRERDYFYPLLVERDGELCYYCNKTIEQVSSLCIHQEIYQRPLNIDNLILLCRSCDQKIRNRPKELKYTPKLKRTSIYNQKDEILCFLLSRDGYFCTDKYGFGCGKSIEQLLLESEQKENTTGVTRMNPVIAIDHINGIPSQSDSDDSILYGNLELLCVSCNVKKGKYQIPIVSSQERMSREKRDSLKNKPKFINFILDYLIENEHGCYKELISAGVKVANGASQISLERYFDSERQTKANKTGKFKIFPYNCGSELCNGDHVIIPGSLPQTLIEERKFQLVEEWTREYGKHKKDWDSHIATYGKPYIEIDDYIKEGLMNFQKQWDSQSNSV